MTFSGNFMPPRFGADAKPKGKGAILAERAISYTQNVKLPPQPNLRPASPQDGDGED